MKIFVVFSVLVVFPAYLRAVAPPNDDCINAIEIDPTSGTVIKGDITEATQDPEWFALPLGYCGATIDTPGIWYKFKNNFTEKVAVTVSTTRDGTEFDTKISVFTGTDDCNADLGILICVGGNDDVSDEVFTSKYTFLAANPMWYFIFVHGCNSCEEDGTDSTGRFEMEVTTNSSYFNVIDPDSNRFAGVLGDNLGYWEIPSSSAKFNIQAVFSSELPVKSVKVSFDDQPSHCERTAPYAVFKERDGNYHGKTIQKGLHTVTATPYAQRNCRGSAGTPMVKEFVVDGCYWINTIYDVKQDGVVGYLYDDYFAPSLPCEFNTEVVALCGFDIDDVRMVLRDEKGKIVHDHTDTQSPYFLFGDHNDKVKSGKLLPGNYTFTSFFNGIEHDTFPFAVGDAKCT